MNPNIISNPASNIHPYKHIQNGVCIVMKWAVELILPLLVLIWAINVFLTYPLFLDNFPYLETTSAATLASIVLIISIRERWFNQLSPLQRRRLMKRGVVAINLLVLVLIGLQIWAYVLVVTNKSVKKIKIVGCAAVSQPMKDATIAMEDGIFYQHNGIDLEAIHRALRFNVRAGRVKVGGSTITQQLAKNLFLNERRTLGRKLLEVPIAFALESQLTKDQILALYMECIPYGMGVKGIDNAADLYFHTKTDQLTLLQSAVLVGLVPHNPKQLPSEASLASWRATALSRIKRRFDGQYDKQITAAYEVPIKDCLYPFRVAHDRGATESIPPGWMGILWFSYISDSDPRTISNVSPLLKQQLEPFVAEARKQFSVVGIYHIGVYADRSQRQKPGSPSAHAFGQAIDISGFRFADGTTIYVSNHNNPDTQTRLRPLRNLLRKHFKHLVDWTNEPKWHQDHIHVEVNGIRLDTRPTSTELRSLSTVNDQKDEGTD